MYPKKLLAATVVTLIACGCTVTDNSIALTVEKHETNKALVRCYYENIVSTGDVTTLAEFISPDYSEVYQGDRYPLGIDGAREHIRSVRRTYPDLRLTIERQIAEGEWVATVVIARGTHRGVWMGMKPTNRSVQITAVNIDKVVGGLIVEHSGAANLLSPLLDIGAIRVADPVLGDDSLGQ